MRSRTDLHNILLTVPGIKKVYYQAPNTILEYPCIIYEKAGYDTKHSNNKLYSKLAKYNIKYIGKNPDNESVVDMLLNLDYCRFDRRYIVDNLYHDVFVLYF